MGLILLIVLILLFFGGLPHFGYSQGYGPSGVVGIILIILVVLLLTGRLR